MGLSHLRGVRREGIPTYSSGSSWCDLPALRCSACPRTLRPMRARGPRPAGRPCDRPIDCRTRAPPHRRPAQVHTLPRARTVPARRCARALCLSSARDHVLGLSAPRSILAPHTLCLTLITLSRLLSGLPRPNRRKPLGAVVAERCAATGSRMAAGDCSAVVQPPLVSVARGHLRVRHRSSTSGAHQSPPCLACPPACRDALLTLCCRFPSLAGRLGATAKHPAAPQVAAAGSGASLAPPRPRRRLPMTTRFPLAHSGLALASRLCAAAVAAARLCSSAACARYECSACPSFACVVHVASMWHDW